MKRIIYILVLLIIFSTNAFAAKKENEFVQSEQYQQISTQANVLYAGNEIKNALELFLSIPENERTPQNWLLIGNILQDQGKNNEAVFMYNKAIEADERFYKAYYNRANIYLQENKLNMAIEDYKKVIKLKPDYAYAHYNLGCAYIKQEKYGKAKFELLLATDYKKTVPEFYYNLAYVYKKLGKEKLANTYLEYYNKLMENQ